VDVHGVFHQLLAPGFPAQQDRMVMAAAIEWDAGETGPTEFRIDLLDPDGGPALTISGSSEVSARNPDDAPPQTRLILPLEDVVFPAPGTYTFELHVGDTTERLCPLHLIENPDAS
jgi:hypothetical protein